MNWAITFNFLSAAMITLVIQFSFASPAGLHNIHGLGKGSTTSYLAPTGYYTCSLNHLGWINCWGANVTGQFGNGNTAGTNRQLPIRSGIIQIDTARSGSGSSSGTTYVITNTGVLMSWGDNIFGKLGTGVDGGASFTPQIVDINTRYKFIKSQYRHTCGITKTDILKCWGYNTDGNLGDGTNTQRNFPVVIDGATTYKAVAVGAYHTCAITMAGVLKCWGLNSNSQLGDGTNTQRFNPVVITSGTAYASVSVGLTHSCAITSAGALKCWGSDDMGQMGDGGIAISRSTPYSVDSGNTYISVSAADDSTCAITTGGVLKCWGGNTTGQLGDGTTVDRTTPVVIDSGVNYISVSAGGYHSCGITTSNLMKCWGYNLLGQLGIGVTGGTQATPTVIAPP